MLTNEDMKTVDELIAVTSDGDLTPLYEALGRQDPATAGWGIENIKEIIHAGKLWWDANEPQARALVCGNSVVRQLAGKDSKETVLAIAAALGAAFGVEKALIAGVLVLRLGLQQWCQAEWK